MLNAVERESGVQTVLYFAGRPVAGELVEGDVEATLTFLTTDHLGAPVYVTDQSGAESWSGGFEPFGEDWQAGTGTGASNNGVFLRLPGQWTDPSWEDATLGAELYYNVNRWYERGTGRYVRPDPLGLVGGLNSYGYAWQDPVDWTDPLGLSPRPMTPSRRRTVPCGPDQYARCVSTCGSKGVESCRVSQVFRLVRSKEGFEVWKWISGPTSCSCNELDQDPLRRCIRKADRALRALRTACDICSGCCIAPFYVLPNDQ